MKILASVPVERVTLSDSLYSYRFSVVEVNVVAVIRHKCDSTRNRYHYEAIVDATPHIAPDYPGLKDGRTRVNIYRKLNPTWKVPRFDDGKNVFWLSEDGTP